MSRAWSHGTSSSTMVKVPCTLGSSTTFKPLIHEISGLNVVLDPNVHGSLTIVLDDVPWDQALDIVLKNNELARELEGNVLRIATVDTLQRAEDARRAQLEAEALAVDNVSVTRFRSYAKAKDVIV